MTNFKIGCSPLTKRLFAGNVLKDGSWGKTKHDVTDTAVSAVAQHLLELSQELHFTYKNERYSLQVKKLQNEL